MTVAERIKERRIQLGLSQTDLANKIGNKDRSTICQLENSGDNISMKNIVRIATALNVTPQYLLGWEDDGAPTVIRKVKPTEEVDEKKVNRALAYLEMFEKATPEVQSMIEYLLKSSQPES